MRNYYLKYLILIQLLFTGYLTQGQSVGNYSVSRATGQTYSSIASTGLSFAAWRYTGGFSEDDNRSIATDIGFDFWYNGDRYTQFSVSTNGFLDFSTSDDDGGPQCDDYGYCNFNFSASTLANGTWLALAPFYDDMTTAGGSDPLGTSIKYQVSGSAPNRILTVEWIGMAVYQNTNPDVNFQVKIYETSGIIEYWYGVMDNGGVGFTYTIGINASSISGTPATSELLTQQTANTATFNNTPQNNLSAMPTANSKLTFTPLTPANPTSLTFSAITNTAMTLSWTDGATNEVGYVLYYSLDNINFFFQDQVAANSTSATATGLLPSTTYYWRVYAVTEGSLSGALSGSATTLAPGTVTSVSAGRWDQTARWDCNCIPTAVDNVIVNHAVELRSNGESNDLTLNNGGSVTFVRNTARTLVINGDLVVNIGASFSVSTSSRATHQIPIGGDIVNNGSINLEADGNSLADLFFTKTIGNQSISGSGSTNNFYSLNLSKALKSNVLEITSSVFTCNADALNFISGGTFKFSSTGTNTFTLFNSTREIPSNGKVIMNSSNGTMNFAGGITLQGDIELVAGTINIGDAADENLTLNGGAITIEGGFLNIAGRLDRNDAESAINYTQTSGILTLPTVGSTSTTLAPFMMDVNGSTFQMSGGTILIQREGGTGGQNLGFINTGASLGNVTDWQLQVGDGVTPAAQNMSIELGTAVGTFVVNSANATAELVGSDLTVLNNVELLTGTLVDNGNNITVAGDWLNAAASFTGSSLVSLTGGNQSITSGTSVFSDITLAGSGTKSILDNLTALGDLTISSTLGLPTGGLQIALGGNWINNGVFSRNNETLLLNGAGAQSVAGSSDNGFTDITINKTGGNVSMDGNLDLFGTMTISSATSVDLDGTGGAIFRLVSSPSDDARIAELATGATLSGNMLFEKYFAGPGFNYWRHISSAVTGASVADLQNEMLITGFFSGSDNGTNGLDPNTQPSLYLYDPSFGLATETFDDRWVNYPSASNTELLTSSGTESRGYAIWLWDASPTTYNLTGLVNFGNQDFNISGANEGWNLLGNPYPSDIGWDNAGWTKTNIQGGAIHIWDGVQYLTWNGTTGSLGNGRIAKGQGFWVQATTGAQLVATEAVKTGTAATTYRTTEALSDDLIMEISLSASGYKDKSYIQFNEQASLEFEIFDAGKLSNSIFNISTLSSDSIPLSINVLDLGLCDISIPLNIDNTWLDDYTLDFSSIEAIDNTYELLLTDSYTEEEYLITNSNSRVSFSITADILSKEPNRFNLLLKPRSLEPELNITSEQICESNHEARLNIGSSQLNAVYEVVVNGSLDTLLYGTGSELEYEIKNNLITGVNTIEVKSNRLGCIEESITFQHSTSIIGNPEILYDENTNLLMSKDHVDGLWYRNDELVSNNPSSFIEPDQIGGGAYYQVVSNETCSKVSNEFLITDIELDRLTTNLEISPNPAEDYIVVSYEGDVDNVIITDVSGKQFYNQTSLDQSINLVRFQPGIYLLTIYSDKEKITKRFIKK